METPTLSFVIPTYRLRNVNETIECYDQHFWRNGHSVRIVVFDDSIPANQEKYFPLLERMSGEADNCATVHWVHSLYFRPFDRQERGYLNDPLAAGKLEGNRAPYAQR
jgi:hypothetical protein